MAVVSPLIQVMSQAAEKAGRALLRDFGEVENLQVSRKGPADFVTTADKKSEEILHDRLSLARPDFGFLMEESGEIKSKGDTRWVIDPLDGTSNFLHGVPHWSISIAAQKGDAIIAGVVFDPLRDEMFWAEKGTGAYLNSKRLRVSGRDELEQALITISTTLKVKRQIPQFIKELEVIANAAPGVRRMGSAALDLSYIAAGRCEAFWGRNLKIWDIAAATLMVTEAGGFVTDAKGGQNFLSGESLLATNSKLHIKMAKLIKETNSEAV